MNFDYNSIRARKARFAVIVTSQAMKLFLPFIAIALVVAALSLLFLQVALGWLLLLVASPIIMLAVWARWELNDIPPQPGAQSVDGLLSSNLLGRLPKDFNPQQLAKIALETPGGKFMYYRFAVTAQLYEAIASNDPAALPAVWQEADRIRQGLGQPKISSAAVLAAILRLVPNINQELAHAKIDADDLVAGVGWYHHIQDVISEHGKRKNDGGIGRDWSFGFTPQLSHFATNISQQVQYGGLLTRDVPSHQAVLDRLVTLFSQGGRQNAALIGPLGTGKTTLIHALAERLLDADSKVPQKLKFQQVFALDPSTLISQAHGRGELEGLIQQLFYEAFAAKNIILFLDDAHLFFEDGTGSVDLSNVLLPILEGGALRIILAMDEQNWLRIAQRNPALAQYLNRVPVAPTNEQETMLILEDQLIIMEHRQNVVYMYQALQEAYRLSDRYMQDQAMPGKALQLLETAAGFAPDKLVTAESVSDAVEKTTGIKVGTANNTDERQTLLNLEDLLHQRMINQTRAVQVVSDALRRARAGVRNPDRPIGTFLFLGPTGVGKTELSKALAAVFFGGEERLVRLDLNEYSQPGDVNRLIADAATDPHSLTAQIAQQPFSVVLLDEIEKAHPNVLNTLLQLLDEGILRDINNRQVSFRDAIIIATSNAGADRIRQYIEAGWQVKDFEQRFMDELINSNQFRPEFLNRFDEVVLFRPLNQDELLQVIDLILKGVNKTLAQQKVSLLVDDDAKRFLVQAGYDPRMGARPMRRVVQRAVENVVAKRMLGGQVMPGEQIVVSLQDVQSALGQEGQPTAGGGYDDQPPQTPAAQNSASPRATGRTDYTGYTPQSSYDNDQSRVTPWTPPEN